MLDLKTIQSESDLTYYIQDDDDYKSTYLATIAQTVVNNYKLDLDSRKEWDETIQKAMDIAKQVMEEKNFPWPKASNIKLPLITKAVINFASRIYPEILPNDRIVKVAVQGQDPNGIKYLRASRVESCMSYQQLASPEWTKGVDSSLHMLPVVGTVFKKTYWCEEENRNISELCNPQDVVVNYNTKSLDSARRITHKIKLSTNEIVEKQRRGTFCEDIKIESLRPDYCGKEDEDFEVELLEQHCWLDLDDDGYKEPYVIIVHEKSLQILRIVSIIDKIERRNGLVLRIDAEKFFTDYHFIPSPDGGFYSLGFGHLLLPLNSAANTLTNQLIDAGTLANTNAMFIGKGLRIKDADLRFRPNEAKVVDAAPGTEIAKQIYQIPVRDPSSVLFELLQFLINMTDDLTKSTEAMNGDMTGANVSRGTMNQMIEQGSKIFTAIYRRFLESLTMEYKKLYRLNYYYLSQKEYSKIIDDPMGDVKKDFELESDDIRPVAEPVYSSMEQKLSKLSMIMNLPGINPTELSVYALQILQFDEKQIQRFLTPPPPAPPPAKDQKELAQAQLAASQAKMAELEAAVLAQRAPLDIQNAAKEIEMKNAQIAESAGRFSKMQHDVAHNEGKLATTQSKMMQQEALKQIQEHNKQAKDTLDAALKDKELNLKAAKAATDAALENKKIDVMAEKTKSDGARSE